MTVGPNFSVQVSGDREAAEVLERMGLRAEDAHSAFAKILLAIMANEEKLWAKSRWPALAPSTLDRKAQQGLDPGVLRATGALERSLTGGGAGAIREVKRDQMRFGTSLFYAVMHEKPRKGEPKRELLKLSPATRRSIREIIADHLAPHNV